MPKRTNEFQSLIALIETQLAPTGAKVTESALLRDRAGRSREVDILIETEVSGKPLAIAVECRDQHRPADQIWVDQLKGKYGDLPVHRIVAVSNSGFTQGALDAADAAKILCFTLEAATTANWVLMTNLPQTLEVIGRMMIPLRLELRTTQRAEKFVDASTTTMSFEGQSYPLTYLVDQLLGLPRADEIVNESLARGITDNIEIDCFLPDGAIVRDAVGDVVPVDVIVIYVRVDMNLQSVPLRKVVYSGAGVATAVAELWPGRVTVAIVNRPGATTASVGVTFRPDTEDTDPVS